MSFQVVTAFWLVMHIPAEHRSLAAGHEGWATLGDATAFLTKQRAVLFPFKWHRSFLLRCSAVLGAGSGGQGCYRRSPGSGS